MTENLRVRDMKDADDVMRRITALEKEAVKNPKKKHILHRAWDDAVQSNGPIKT
jgi:hypothetical protein